METKKQIDVMGLVKVYVAIVAIGVGLVYVVNK